jgi:hypothetical protein
VLALLLAQSMHWEYADWSTDRQRTSYEVAYAPVWFRPIGSADPGWARGSEIALGARTVTRAAPFLFSLSTRPALRILDGQSYALSFVQTVSVGLGLGPLEPDVGGGFSTITVDSIHGQWSAELLSPRAAAGAWIHFGSFRLGAHVYGEYLWRWFGNDSYLLRGVSIELGLEAQRPQSRR